MTSFVETATLRVNDQSTKKIKAIDKALASLFRTSGRFSRDTIGPKIDPRSVSQVKALSRAVNDLHSKASRRSIVPAVSLKGIRTAQSEVTKLQSMMRSLQRGGRVRGFGNRFPGNLPAIGNRVLGYDAVLAARATGLAGARAVGDRSSEIFTQRALGIPEDKIQSLNALAREASAGLLMTSETQARMVSRNLLMAGATEKTVKGLTRAQLEIQQSTGALLGKQQAERFGEQVVKVLDLAGRLDQPEKAESVVRALGAAQLVAGRDLKFNQVLNAFRNTAGLVMGMNQSAMQDFVFAVEEGGRRTAQGLRSFDRELNSNNVAKKNLRMLMNAGLRTSSGAVDSNLQATDFTAWIEKHITSKASKQGVDLENLAAVRKFISSLGFMQSATTFLSSEVLKREERKRARARAKNIKFDKLQSLASKDIISAAKMVSAQFNDLSANTLTKFTNKFAAPALVDFAKLLSAASRGEATHLTRSNIKGAALVGGAATGAFVASNAGTIAMTVAAIKLRGSGNRLNTAAAALTRAAVVQGGAGATGTTGKKRKRKKRGKGLVGLLGVAGTAAIAAELFMDGDEAGAREQLGKAKRKFANEAANTLNTLDGVASALRGKIQKIDGVKGGKHNPNKIPVPVSRPKSKKISAGVTKPTPRPALVKEVTKIVAKPHKKLPGFQKQDDMAAVVRGIAADMMNVRDTRNSLSNKGVNNKFVSALSKNNVARIERSQTLLSTNLTRGETIASAFGADVAKGVAASQNFTQAATLAGTNIMSAFQDGAGFAANAIRTAFAGSINVNVNQNTSSSASTGSTSLVTAP